MLSLHITVLRTFKVTGIEHEANCKEQVSISPLGYLSTGGVLVLVYSVRYAVVFVLALRFHVNAVQNALHFHPDAHTRKRTVISAPISHRLNLASLLTPAIWSNR